jgi:type I restriction enzyme M protein
MVTTAPSIVSKVWNYAHVLRDDGVSYGDYVEQITCLLFLKMAYEGSTLLHEESPIPEGYGWESLVGKDGDELEFHYRHVLEALGREPGMLGTIFRKAQNKIQDPAKLKRLISLMDSETWLEIDADVKGDIYEGLLERNAADVKSGAGNTSRPARSSKQSSKSCAQAPRRPSAILLVAPEASCSPPTTTSRITTNSTGTRNAFSATAHCGA